MSNKGNDARAPKSHWPHCEGPIDIVFFEGWFVGARPQVDTEFTNPVNTLEKDEGPQRIWNDALKCDYQELFSLLDCLIFLKIPHIKTILKRRGLQEQKPINQRHHERHLMNPTRAL